MIAGVIVVASVILVGVAFVLFYWSVSPIAALLDSGETWSDEAVAKTEQRGQLVIDAVVRYRSDHGALPRTLEELVPAYLPQVPRPKVGDREWLFGPLPDDPSEFYLAIRPRFEDNPFYFGPELMNYRSLEGEWDVHVDPTGGWY